MDETTKEIRKRPPIQVGATVTQDLYDQAMIQGISWSEAIRFGTQFLLAEKNEHAIEFPENVLTERISKIMKRLHEVTEERDVLQRQIEILNRKLGVTPTNAEAEAKAIIDNELARADIYTDDDLNKVVEDIVNGSSK